MSSKTAPYGHWKSPLTAELLAGSSISLQEVAVNVSGRCAPDLTDLAD